MLSLVRGSSLLHVTLPCWIDLECFPPQICGAQTPGRTTEWDAEAAEGGIWRASLPAYPEGFTHLPPPWEWPWLFRGKASTEGKRRKPSSLLCPLLWDGHHQGEATAWCLGKRQHVSTLRCQNPPMYIGIDGRQATPGLRGEKNPKLLWTGEFPWQVFVSHTETPWRNIYWFFPQYKLSLSCTFNH